jgi:hypothetical protein
MTPRTARYKPGVHLGKVGKGEGWAPGVNPFTRTGLRSPSGALPLLTNQAGYVKYTIAKML